MILKNDKTIYSLPFRSIHGFDFFKFFLIIGLRPKLGNTYYHIRYL